MQGPIIEPLRVGAHLNRVIATTGQQWLELCEVIDALLEHQQRVEHLFLGIDDLTLQSLSPIVDRLVVRLRSDHTCLQSLIDQLSTARTS